MSGARRGGSRREAPARGCPSPPRGIAARATKVSSSSTPPSRNSRMSSSSLRKSSKMQRPLKGRAGFCGRFRPGHARRSDLAMAAAGRPWRSADCRPSAPRDSRGGAALRSTVALEMMACTRRDTAVGRRHARPVAASTRKSVSLPHAGDRGQWHASRISRNRVDRGIQSAEAVERSRMRQREVVRRRVDRPRPSVGRLAGAVSRPSRARSSGGNLPPSDSRSNLLPGGICTLRRKQFGDRCDTRPWIPRTSWPDERRESREC